MSRAICLSGPSGLENPDEEALRSRVADPATMREHCAPRDVLLLLWGTAVAYCPGQNDNAWSGLFGGGSTDNAAASLRPRARRAPQGPRNPVSSGR